MSRLTGTAELVSREIKFSGANEDKEILIFPTVQLTTGRIANLITRLILTLDILYICNA